MELLMAFMFAIRITHESINAMKIWSGCKRRRCSFNKVHHVIGEARTVCQGGYVNYVPPRNRLRLRTQSSPELPPNLSVQPCLSILCICPPLPGHSIVGKSAEPELRSPT